MTTGHLIRLSSALALLFATDQQACAAPAASLPVGYCINTGNMLDSDDWGGKKLDSTDFRNIREHGFDTVRIPANWANHASTTAPYTIDPVWMTRVTAMVDAGLANGLNVIIDSHYFPDLYADPAANTDRLAALWRQIGAKLANRPRARLWFEIVNEPHDGLTSANLWATIGPALAAIRATNPDRPVIVGGGDYSTVNALATLNLPNDPNVWPTFHYFDPMDFTHQGATWISPVPPLGRAYGTTWDKAEVAANVQKVKAFVVRTGKVPFIGETGAYTTVPLSQRVAYHSAVHKAFAAIGVAQCEWAYTNTFQFYDYQTKKWLGGLLPAIGVNEQH